MTSEAITTAIGSGAKGKNTKSNTAMHNDIDLPMSDATAMSTVKNTKDKKPKKKQLTDDGLHLFDTQTIGVSNKQGKSQKEKQF